MLYDLDPELLPEEEREGVLYDLDPELLPEEERDGALYDLFPELLLPEGLEYVEVLEVDERL